MRRNQLLTRRALLLFVCLSALTGFVLARRLPASPAAPQQGSGNSSSPAAPSPTPSSSPPAGGTTTAPPRLAPRDLTRYDRGGPFAVGAQASGAPREAVMGEARGFLLERWRGRRRAQMVLRFARPGGGVTDSTFYVEPDETGRWCVVLVSAGGTEVFRVVEEVEMAEDGTPLAGEDATEGQNSRAVRGVRLKQSAESNSGLIL